MSYRAVSKRKSRGSAGIVALLGISALIVQTSARADSRAASTQPGTGPSSTTTPTSSTSTAPASSAESETKPRLNILVLMTKDQARGFTGFEGNELAKTPHLDRLALRGVQFTRCYVPTPQGGPSAAAMLTGQYPHMNGVTADGMPLSEHADTFTARLKRAGYACGLVGGWEFPLATAGKPDFGITDYVAIAESPKTAEDWSGGVVHKDGQEGRSDRYLDDWTGDRAVEALERFNGRPFFLWVNFQGPGEPFVYPPGMEDSFPAAAMELPKPQTNPAQALPQKVSNSPAAQRFKQMNEQQLREARSKYMAMIARIDENVGRILRKLDQLELVDNTVIVFVSSSGFALGEHQLFGEAPAFFDEIIRVPLCVRWPSSSEGQKVERVVSLVDLCPTFCEVASIAKPFGIQGRSLVPLMNDRSRTDVADERFLEYFRQPAWTPSAASHAPSVAAARAAPAASSSSAVGPGLTPPPAAAPGPPPVEARVRGIVTSRYKLIDYLDDQDLLYDLQRDPEQLHNVMSDFQYKPVQQVLYDRLRQWRQQTRDPWPPQ